MHFHTAGMRLGASQGDLLRADTSSSYSLLQPKATYGWIYPALGQPCVLSCIFRRFRCGERWGAPLTPPHHKAKAVTSSPQCLPGPSSVRFSHLHREFMASLCSRCGNSEPKALSGLGADSPQILLLQLFLSNELQNPLIHFLSFYYQLQVSKYFPICLLTVQSLAFPAQ